MTFGFGFGTFFGEVFWDEKGAYRDADVEARRPFFVCWRTSWLHPHGVRPAIFEVVSSKRSFVVIVLVVIVVIVVVIAVIVVVIVVQVAWDKAWMRLGGLFAGNTMIFGRVQCASCFDQSSERFPLGS